MNSSKFSFRYFAEQELVSAQNLIKSGIGLNVAAVLMQQSLEKLLLHILGLRNIEAPRTHSLLKLYTEAYPNKIDEYRGRLREISSMYFSMRYPNDDFYEIDQKEADRIWDIFSQIYKELEIDADSLEVAGPAVEDTTSLF